MVMRDGSGMDDRGLAFGIFRVIVALAFFALMYAVFNQFMTGFFDGSLVGLGTAGSSEIGELQGYLADAWIYLPVFALFALSLRVIARAAFESRGGVR